MTEVCNLQDALDGTKFGGKAANLARMLHAGLPVPGGLAVGLGAFDEQGKLIDKDSVTKQLDTSKLYAVRSSALAEDSEVASWAGQFETFLDTEVHNVIAKIEACHNSAKDRVKAYANEKGHGSDKRIYEVAVVVQEMVKPEYAGVLFTKDPVSGAEVPVTEYVKGLGEELVSGRADPWRLVLDGSPDNAPFDSEQLTHLAYKVEKLFGKPQDIEWVWADGKFWLVQARPITAASHTREGYYLGEPNELFYWGPSRGTPRYMGDFMAAVTRTFTHMTAADDLPTPPPTLVLFDDAKMVWLNNAHEFNAFVRECFTAYTKRNQLEQDIRSWRLAAERVYTLQGQELTAGLVNAWCFTELAEFSLYGAESCISERLRRFDERTLPKIWGAFTTSDTPTFLNALDAELAQSGDANVMAKKYPWIRDGYAGPNNEAVWYFQQRREAIKRDGLLKVEDYEPKRQAMIVEYQLTKHEVSMLTLARKLAEFMDERKQWMMRTRRLITGPNTDIKHGWYFSDSVAKLINKADTRELWQRYVSFKSAVGVVKGTVANTGGRHFVSGEVAVLNSHVDPVGNDKILVVPSTSPGWVPLMRHARALITDHGGMMSHAAIVAREFNLPCIVSTKQATKVLRTGDTVILDLVSGEVNK